jgi:hypothetical protein
MDLSIAELPLSVVNRQSVPKSYAYQSCSWAIAPYIGGALATDAPAYLSIDGLPPALASQFVFCCHA